MKRIISVIILMLLISQSAVYASEISPDVMFEITSLGIMQGDEQGDLHPDEFVKRSEFAAVMIRLLGYDSLRDSLSGSVSYQDVPAEHWAGGYISAVTEIGLMNGYSTEAFGPDDNVSYEQTVKTMVAALGYGMKAKQMGGYPGGYLSVGGSLGLLKNVVAEPFDRGQLMVLIANSLDVDMVVQDGYVGDRYEIREGNTLRSILMDERDGSTLHEERGIVTANVHSWLNAPNASLKLDEVEIDDIRYYVGGTDAASFFGMEVEFYFSYEDGVRTIRSIKPTAKNHVREIPADEISFIDLSGMEYDGEKDKIDFDEPIVIKNGRRIMLPEDSDLLLSKGFVRLIDHNDDDRTDVVILEDYENLQVRSVNENVVEFTEKSKFGGTKFLNIDLESDIVQFILLDAAGNAAEVSDIEQDDILSVSADADFELCKIVISKRQVEGVLSEQAQNYIVVGEEEVPVYEDFSGAAQIGAEVAVFLDYMGYAAALEEMEAPEHYGYLIGTETAAGIGDRINLKFLVGSVVSFEFDKNENNPDDKNEIPVVKCQNDGVRILEAAPSLSKDRRTYKGEDRLSALTPGMYRFDLDSEGRLRRLWSAEYFGGGADMSYNVYDKVFAGNNWREPVAIDENTVVLCLPSNATTDNADYLVPLEISNKGEVNRFYVEGFDMDPATKKAKAIVFQTIMRADDVVNINQESSPVAMVAYASKCLDSEGEEAVKISLVTKEGKKDYVVRVSSGKNDVMNTLRVGDFIYYEEGLAGNLDDAKVIRSFDTGLDSFIRNDGRVDQQVSGYVRDMIFDEPDKSSGNLQTMVKMDTSDGSYSLPVNQRNAPAIFIYDSHKESVRLGSISDIVPQSGAVEESEMLYALTPYGTSVKACVIYR